MRDWMRKIYYDFLKLFPVKLVRNINNLRSYHRLFRKPEFFGEKLQWIATECDLSKYTPLVDKYLVRKYIAEKIGEEYLIPLIGAYDNPDDIDFSKLPKSFVLKANHGSGYNYLVKNKDDLNEKRVKKLMQSWLKEDYYKINKEYQYKNVEKKIICEKFVTDKTGELLDYKFFCFNGEPYFVKVDYDRYSNHTTKFYDMNWNAVEMSEQGFGKYAGEGKKPENFDKMVELARKLSKDFPFVRVDLYNVDGKIYFGELTFTPAGGKHAFFPLEKDKKFADLIDLKKYQKKYKVLMVGPARTVKGGMSSVINSFYTAGISKNVEIKYLGTTIDKNKLLKICYMFKNFLAFLFIVHKYDIIHIHTASGNSFKRKSWYARISKIAKKKVILHIHGGAFKDFYKNSSIRGKKSIIATLNRADKIIVLSDTWKDFLTKLKIPDSKIEILPNGVLIPPHTTKHSTNSLNIVFLGRLVKEKGIYELIEAMKMLEDYSDIKLYICGDDDKKTTKNIEFLGWINDDEKAKIFQKSDIIILPSYIEAMPLSIIEGMSYGLVPIATNVGSIPEIIDNNKNGILLETPEPKNICSAILDIKADKEKRIRMSALARKTIESSYNLEKNLERLIDMYKKLIAEKL